MKYHITKDPVADVSAPTDERAEIRAAYCKEYALPVDDIDYECLQWTAFASGFDAARAAAPVSGPSDDLTCLLGRIPDLKLSSYGPCEIEHTIDWLNELRKAWASRPRSEDSRAEVLEEALRIVAQTLAWQAHGECRGFHDKLYTSADAIEVSKLALATSAAPGRSGKLADDESAWEALRADVLYVLDGFDNDQTNAVLSLIDFYTPGTSTASEADSSSAAPSEPDWTTGWHFANEGGI